MFKDKRLKKEHIVNKKKKVIHEKIDKVNHICRVFIQPIHRTIHAKRTLVYMLPTKHVEDKNCKDYGIKYIKVNKEHKHEKHEKKNEKHEKNEKNEKSDKKE
jgi:hypothetical protein